MSRLGWIAVGGLVGAAGLYGYAQHLRSHLTNLRSLIANPFNASDPNVQAYNASWNQLSTLGGVSDSDPNLPPLSTLQAEYNQAQMHSIQPG